MAVPSPGKSAFPYPSSGWPRLPSASGRSGPIRRAFFVSTVGLDSTRSADPPSATSRSLDSCTVVGASSLGFVVGSDRVGFRLFLSDLHLSGRSRSAWTPSSDEEDDGDGVSSQNTSGCFFARCNRFLLRNSAWFLASTISSSLLPPGGRHLRVSLDLPRAPWRRSTSVDMAKTHAKCVQVRFVRLRRAPSERVPFRPLRNKDRGGMDCKEGRGTRWRNDLVRESRGNGTVQNRRGSTRNARRKVDVPKRLRHETTCQRQGRTTWRTVDVPCTLRNRKVERTIEEETGCRRAMESNLRSRRVLFTEHRVRHVKMHGASY